jgi:hypothetical protein
MIDNLPIMKQLFWLSYWFSPNGSYTKYIISILYFILQVNWCRFDDLCFQISCEEIATIGDCYYCASECSESGKNHAKFYLVMINTIEELNEVYNERVDMRVGVHWDSINCEIVWTRKFLNLIFFQRTLL